MDIDITQTTIKRIKGTLGKPFFSMEPSANQYSGTIIFPVTTTNEGMVLGFTTDSMTVVIKPQDWNVFWAQFNNGKFLIETLKAQYDITDLIIPTDIETWFTNVL